MTPVEYQIVSGLNVTFQKSKRLQIQDACADLPNLCTRGLNYPKRICYLTFSTNVSSALIEINLHFSNAYYPNANLQLINRHQC